MLVHYSTLTHLSRWLDQMLAGKSIREVFSQSRNELMICFGQGEELSGLRISVEPHKNFAYLVHDVRRAKRNTVDLFPSVIGKTVVGITAGQHDRMLLLHCPDQRTVAILLYGSSANVLVVDDQHTIIDAFVRAKETTGKTFSWEPDSRSGPAPLISQSEFLAAFTSANGTSLRDVLKSVFPSLGKTLTDEILHQTNHPSNTPAGSLGDEQKQTIYMAVKNLLDRLVQPSPRIYYDQNSPVSFALVPLVRYSNLRCEQFDSINEALRVYISKSLRAEHFGEEHSQIERRIRAELVRVERTIGKIRQDLADADRAAQYERYGNILMAYAGSLTQTQENVTLEDPSTGSQVTIPLDPRMTPIRNAGKYFDRAKKSRVARRESEERLQALEKTSAELHILQENILRCSTGDDLKEFKRTYAHQLQAYHIVKNEKKEPEVPFRIFHVAGGFEVWAGKSSRNNDELTLQYAKPNDLWFHARGSSGSHIVLRSGTGNGEPSKEAKEQAAAIAAYYSKQRNAKYVPVAMTEKKYVRKPKGATPGTVVIEREKVIMVTPALPTQNERQR